jgi:hypothetical protein
MSTSEEFHDQQEASVDESACTSPLDTVTVQCLPGQETLEGGGERVGRSSSPPTSARRTWRPATPHAALKALEQGVPFDSLDLSSVEQALLHLLSGRTDWRNVSLLREAVNYRDTKYGDAEHVLALARAVEDLSHELDTQPLGPQGRNRKGRPKNVEPYRPVTLWWDVLLRWHLPWLFRKELDKAGQEPEPALSLDMSMGHDEGGNTITLHDLLSEESWLGFRAMRERDRTAQRLESRETLFHHRFWSIRHGQSKEMKQALSLTHKTVSRPTLSLDGKVALRTTTRRVSPPLRSAERRALQNDMRQFPRGDIGRLPPTQEPREDGHADNKAFVARWRAEHQAEKVKGEQMSTATANVIIEKLDGQAATLARLERLEGMRAETMDSIREGVEALLLRLPDDERIQHAVGRFLGDEGA